MVAWDASDLTGHIVGGVTGTFDIKIIRTKSGSLSPSPILGYAKTATTTEYIWDKDGDVNVKSITMTDDLAVADGGTGKSNWTQYLIPYADTTTSFSQIAIGTSSQVLTSNGAGSVATFQDASGGVNGYPQRATLWHDEATVTNGNALLLNIDTAQRYSSRIYQNVAATGDAFSQSFFLKAGTYEFSVLGSTLTSGGQVDWSVDGGSIVANQEWYSGSTIKNVIKTVSSISIATDGYHKLTGVVDSQHVSSSGYSLQLTKYWFWVASADPARE